jgi:hypothetical protein
MASRSTSWIRGRREGERRRREREREDVLPCDALLDLIIIKHPRGLLEGKILKKIRSFRNKINILR